MYRDIQEKIKFHKERVIQSFIDLGIYPSNDLIKNMLYNIDSRSAYLQTVKVKKGMEFDCEQFNIAVNSIFKDLELLYSLLYELSIKEYVQLQGYIDTHLYDLKKRTEFYKEKAEEEVNTTSLGKTLLFKNGSFDIKLVNNVSVYDLGEINLLNGSRVACLLHATDVTGDKAIFSFIKDNVRYNVCPHNYNQDVFDVPGELAKNEYVYEIDADQKITGSLKIESVTAPSHDNKYDILGGKDKVLVKQLGEVTKTSIKNKPLNVNELGFHEKSYVSFYLVGAKSVTFTFNKKPIHANFPMDNYHMDNLNDVHYFFMEVEPGFSFSFSHDGGEVYAIKTPGIITDNALVYTGSVKVDTFKVIEYLNTAKETYRLQLEIVNEDNLEADVQKVIVKQLALEA